MFLCHASVRPGIRFIRNVAGLSQRGAGQSNIKLRTNELTVNAVCSIFSRVSKFMTLDCLFGLVLSYTCVSVDTLNYRLSLLEIR